MLKNKMTDTIKIKLMLLKEKYEIIKTIKLVKKLEKNYKIHPLEIQFMNVQFKTTLINLSEKLLNILSDMNQFSIIKEYKKFLNILTKNIQKMCKKCLKMCFSQTCILPIESHAIKWSKFQISFLFILKELEFVQFHNLSSYYNFNDSLALQFWKTNFDTKFTIYKF